MTRPTIIMAAPNGARKVKTDHPAVPVTITETIATAKECHAAGASILHAHVRDDDGKHLLDAGRYRQLLDGLRHEVPEMLVQITTEAVGIYTPEQQADLVFALKPDFVSVGFREMIGDNGEAARALAGRHSDMRPRTHPRGHARVGIPRRGAAGAARAGRIAR